MKRLLDLYCCAGGSSKGYQRAGFHVTGVDANPQPRHCGDEFIQGDALEYLEAHGHEYDAIHASPPCQGYSIMHNLPWLRGREYPRLIKPTRDLLNRIGRPWVLENVMGARWGCKNLVNISKQLGYDITEHGMKASYLCGQMFEFPFYRHRLFEANWLWMAPGHPKHTMNLHPRSERYVYGGDIKGLNGGAAGLDTKPRHPNPVNSAWRKTHDGGQPENGAQKNGVGIGHTAGWKLAAEAMGIDWMKREELTQAIPPVYTEYIGEQLMRYLEGGDR